MDLGSFNKRVLLTGAGFTKNWRGLLATEFWSHLLSSPYLRENQEIRYLLLDKFDFEEVYGVVQTGDYSEDDKTALNNAIGGVLQHQENLLDRAISSPESNMLAGLAEFLKLFTTGTGEESGIETSYIFTLNYDLLLEKALTLHPWNPSPNLPGVSAYEGWPQADWHIQGHILQTVRGLASKPPKDWPPRLDGHHNYVKLHGSKRVGSRRRR